MEQIFKCYLSIFLLLLLTSIQAGILSGAGQILCARNQFCDYVNRLEAADGNLNEAKIIIDEAKNKGYEVCYSVTSIPSQSQSPDEEALYLKSLSMSYQVSIPCLGVMKTESLERSLN